MRDCWRITRRLSRSLHRARRKQQPHGPLILPSRIWRQNRRRRGRHRDAYIFDMSFGFQIVNMGESCLWDQHRSVFSREKRY